MKPFKSLIEFQKHFDTDAKCRAYLEQERWNGKPVCPHCKSEKVYRFKDGKRFNCGNPECKSIFSVTVGTMYENSKLSLDKWFLAMYIISVHSKGISSLQLANILGIGQKAAWFLNHRIREAFKDNGDELLTDVVEVDETFVGGKHGNRHAWKREEIKQAGFKDKTMVVGLVQRGKNKKVKTRIAPNTFKETLHDMVKDNVQPGATVYTDELNSYKGLAKDYNHDTVKHSGGEYVRGSVYTNTIEGFFSLLKRQIVGIHHNVSPKHLHRYCVEVGHRYNSKDLTQDVRFQDTLKRCEVRLKYKDLIAKSTPDTNINENV